MAGYNESRIIMLGMKLLHENKVTTAGEARTMAKKLIRQEKRSIIDRDSPSRGINFSRRTTR